ncbi:hypothetical protein [Amycolatopsis sp. NPDC058986]|uniref:hypothetical protein n=1 Tax=unclassified Amycolatopsis TaxID=2618356 RepID=UPI003671D0B1
MATPGFPPGALDESGFPVWSKELAGDDPNHLVHVVRDLDPRTALRVLGAEPDRIVPCVLPAAKPDEWTSLPQAALGTDAPEDGTVLLAGRAGAWTFVYDDAGLTYAAGPDDIEAAAVLSAAGGVAAMANWTINGDTGLDYGVDGMLVFSTAEGIDPDLDGDRLPAELRPAVDAAGFFDLADLRASGLEDPDDGIDDIDEEYLDCGRNWRVVCALAGFRLTLDDLRRLPLLMAPREGN